MKPSAYNYIFENNGYSYWYNGLEHSFFRLTSSLGEKIKHILNTPEILKSESQTFYENLISKGFLVEDSYDELNEIRKRNHDAKHHKNYFLVLLPTLNCNFNCWYCIQDHIPSMMSDQVIENVKRHIDYMVDSEKIETLNIEWFGGEPFLYFSKVIVPISEYAIRKCKEADIQFTNSATTNGYYISNNVIPELARLQFKGFQITLDGDREHHDKVKFTKNCASAFEHVLTNINNILSSSPDINVLLRINYTHETLSDRIVEEVNQYIHPQNRRQTQVILKKVWQERTDKSFHNFAINLLNKFRQSGYNVQKLDIVAQFVPCYANRKYYNAINYNGNVVKCTACNDLYENPAPGLLQDNGTIKWSGRLDEKYLESSYENDRCLKCRYLPICMGLCPRDYNNGANYCKMDAVDNNVMKSIIEYIYLDNSYFFPFYSF